MILKNQNNYKRDFEISKISEKIAKVNGFIKNYK